MLFEKYTRFDRNFKHRHPHFIRCCRNSVKISDMLECLHYTSVAIKQWYDDISPFAFQSTYTKRRLAATNKPALWLL